MTGLRRYGGYVREEFLPKLMGDRAIAVYEEMQANSPVVGASLFAIDMLMRQVGWRVEPVDESPAALEVATFVDECRSDMSHTWEDLLSEVFSFVPYGWSYHELVYKVRNGPQAPSSRTAASKFADGRIGWRKIPIRAQSSRLEWMFDEQGGIRGMVQMAPPTFQRVELPIEKCLLFRPGAHKNNPEGRSSLRRAYRPWYFAKRIEEVEAIGVERDLAGLPVIEVPAELTATTASEAQQAAYAAFKKMATNIRMDEQMGVVLPQAYDQHGNKLYTLSLLASAGSRKIDTVPILQRYYSQIAMTVMADFLMLGHEKVGSFALADNKTNLFSVALGAWLDAVAETFNRYAIPRLLALNGMDPALAPTLAHGDIETPDLTQIADYIGKLVTAGMPVFPDLRVENILRGYAKLPELTEEEFEERAEVLEEQKVAEAEAALELATAGKPTVKPGTPANLKE